MSFDNSVKKQVEWKDSVTIQLSEKALFSVCFFFKFLWCLIGFPAQCPPPLSICRFFHAYNNCRYNPNNNTKRYPRINNAYREFGGKSFFVLDFNLCWSGKKGEKNEGVIRQFGIWMSLRESRAWCFVATNCPNFTFLAFMFSEAMFHFGPSASIFLGFLFHDLLENMKILGEVVVKGRRRRSLKTWLPEVIHHLWKSNKLHEFTRDISVI